MLIKITQKDYRYLYHFWETFIGFRSIECWTCKKKINYLRKDTELIFRCPKCNQYSFTKDENIELFEKPDYGLSEKDVVKLIDRLQNNFEYEPEYFDDDELKEQDLFLLPKKGDSNENYTLEIASEE
jgi:predicted RNA-binding Zn-ribbon protein involved in translation (DUF1610 family)